MLHDWILRVNIYLLYSIRTGGETAAIGPRGGPRDSSSKTPRNDDQKRENRSGLRSKRSAKKRRGDFALRMGSIRMERRPHADVVCRADPDRGTSQTAVVLPPIRASWSFRLYSQRSSGIAVSDLEGAEKGKPDVLPSLEFPKEQETYMKEESKAPMLEYTIGIKKQFGSLRGVSGVSI
jgi:hypothetical protein